MIVIVIGIDYNLCQDPVGLTSQLVGGNPFRFILFLDCKAGFCNCCSTTGATNEKYGTIINAKWSVRVVHVEKSQLHYPVWATGYA